MKHSVVPDKVITVFAGADIAATDRARGYFKGYFPSSPSVGLLQNGQIVFMLERHQVEGRDPVAIAQDLTNAFDRMLHLTAYARTKNPKVIVVAGGPPIRALPALSRRFFDYPCPGDIEQLREVIIEVFGPAFAAEEMVPRYDLADWLGNIGHVESSRAWSSSRRARTVTSVADACFAALTTASDTTK